MMALSIFSFVTALAAMVMALRLRKIHRRIVRLKDKEIRELAQRIWYFEREAWQLREYPMADFGFEETENCFSVYGYNSDCMRKIVVRSFRYTDEESRVLAMSEAEELVDALKGRWSCVG